ncbi:MAG: 5-formyltetrahydrofolate cyclo-ligase [Limnothrix sp. RL_2_0]|nr:5-formyltetrahydrofolate cyclo-ligase [Limnothrix sp. RL_2_0]
MDQSKSVLRQYFLSKRRSLSMVDWRTQSQKICDQLQQHKLFTESHTVLSYLSYRNEPDLAALFEVEKSWGLPRCVGKKLAWHGYQKGDHLISGKYGLTEPHPDLPLINLDEIDLILVPAVACSKNGDRLGYGGGFYDRFLDSLNHPVTTVGIIFDYCLAAELPRDPWDKPLNYICTENEIISI